MSLRPDCPPSSPSHLAVVAPWQRLAGSLVKGVLEQSQEGFQSKEEVVLGGDLPPLHSQEACSRSRTLKVSKFKSFSFQTIIPIKAVEHPWRSATMLSLSGQLVGGDVTQHHVGFDHFDRLSIRINKRVDN